MYKFRKEIEALTLKLQRQTQVPLWALADEILIDALAFNESPVWGLRHKVVLKLMFIADKMKLVNFIIFIIGLGQVLTLYLSASKHKKDKGFCSEQYKYIFAGFGAASEKALFQSYQKKNQASVLRINWVTQAGLLKLGNIKFSNVLMMLIKNSWGLSQKYNDATQEIKSHKQAFCTVAALNIGAYSFYQSYWKLAKNKNIQEVVFVAPSMAAYAAVDQQIMNKFLQHGLLAQSILFPKFDTVEMLTSSESAYMKKIHPKIEVIDQSERVVRCNELQPVVIILSPDTFNQSIGENVEPMIDFYKWAKMSGLCVVIRLNPKGSAEKQFALKSYFPDAILDDSTVSLNMSYEKWKPKMVFSWRSTGLAIALQYGFLPVSCFTRTDKKRPLGRAIYPLADCVLFWPEEKALMQNAIGDSAMYNTTILRLQQPLAILPETAESP